MHSSFQLAARGSFIPSQAHTTSIMAASPNLEAKDDASPLTMTVLGCGTMGIAILGGILSSLDEINSTHSRGPSYPTSGSTTPMDDLAGCVLPSRFIACVKRPESAKKVRQALCNNPALEVVRGENVASVDRAEIILLACKPYMVEELLTEQGMKEALSGKVLVSILAGVSKQQIEGVLGYDDDETEEQKKSRCLIVRAMPNTAALIRESMTVIATSAPPLPPKVASLVTWILRRLGMWCICRRRPWMPAPRCVGAGRPFLR